MKTFEVLEGHKTEVTESTRFIELNCEARVDNVDVKRFEKEFNCKFFDVMPYTRYGGVNWVCLRFTKS